MVGVCQRSLVGITWLCLFVCVPVYLCLFWRVHACAQWRQTFPSASQTTHDIWQMFTLTLSWQIDLFHSDRNEHVLFSSLPPLPYVNGRRWNQFSPSSFEFTQLNLPPSFSLNLCPWLSILSSSPALPQEKKKNLLFVARASQADLRNEPITSFFFSSLVCVCWIIEVNGAFFCFFFVFFARELCASNVSVAQTASCESCISAGFMWS